MLIARLICSAVFLALLSSSVVDAQTAGRITGVGGIFGHQQGSKEISRMVSRRARHPRSRDGRCRAPLRCAESSPVWSGMPSLRARTMRAPSTRDFMIDFAVDDLDAFVARLQSKGSAL